MALGLIFGILVCFLFLLSKFVSCYVCRRRCWYSDGWNWLLYLEFCVAFIHAEVKSLCVLLWNPILHLHAFVLVL